MYDSFNDQEFESAMHNKDYSKLKSFLISAIRNNPGFKGKKELQMSEAKHIFNRIKKECPEMLDNKYVLQDGERAFDLSQSDSWDRKYFLQETFYFGENFCVDRYNQLMDIGQAITGNPNFLDAQEQPEMVSKVKKTVSKSEVPTSQKKQKKAVLIMAAVVMVLAVVILVMSL